MWVKKHVLSRNDWGTKDFTDAKAENSFKCGQESPLSIKGFGQDGTNDHSWFAEGIRDWLA